MSTPLTARDRLATAVDRARHYRHYSDCRCWLYRDSAGEGFCTREEAHWSAMADRILSDVLREPSKPAA